MNRDVDETIPAGVQAAERVIDSEGQADERSARQRRSLFGRRERCADMTNLLVDDDGVVVIEGEGRRKTIPVDGEADEGEEKRALLQLRPRWSST
jgi:hypothetical protein